MPTTKGKQKIPLAMATSCKLLLPLAMDEQIHSPATKQAIVTRLNNNASKKVIKEDGGWPEAMARNGSNAL